MARQLKTPLAAATRTLVQHETARSGVCYQSTQSLLKSGAGAVAGLAVTGPVWGQAEADADQ